MNGCLFVCSSVCLSVFGPILFTCMSTVDWKFRDNAVAAVAGNSIFCFSPAVTATAAVEVAASSSSSSSSSAKLKYVPALPQSGHIRPVVPLEPLSLLNPAATSAAAAAAVADITSSSSSSSTNSGLKFDPGLIKEEPGVTVSKSSVNAAISKRSADLTTDGDVEQQSNKAPRTASMSAATSKNFVDLATSDDDDVEPQRKKAPRAAVAPRLKCPCFNVKDNVHCRLQGLHSAHEMRQEHHAQWGCFKGSCSAKLHHSCLKSYNPCFVCHQRRAARKELTGLLASFEGINLDKRKIEPEPALQRVYDHYMIEEVPELKALSPTQFQAKLWEVPNPATGGTYVVFGIWKTCMQHSMVINLWSTNLIFQLNGVIFGR